MRSIFASVVLLALAALPSTLAAPAIQIGKGKIFACPIKSDPTLPTNQTAIQVNPVLKKTFVALGVGFQNYSCSAAGTYASAGAVAALYDVSCLIDKPIFKTLPDLAMKLGGFAQRGSIIANIAKTLGGNPLSMGDHFFQPNPAGGIQPVFDYTKSQGKSSFVVAAKAAGIPSPDGAKNVDWLLLKKVAGNIGDEIMRLDTRAGLAPNTTCTPGSPIVISPYAAVYWTFTA